MDQAVMTALFNNVAILLVLAVVFDAAYFLPFKRSRTRQIFSGLMISMISIAIMNIPFTLQSGIIYDTRSILISVTALVFGPLPTAMFVVTTAVFRVSIGGIGTLQGLGVILTSALIGLAWRRWIYPKATKWKWVSVLLMSIAVHVAMLACTLLIPYPESRDVLNMIALPVLFIFPVVTVLLCNLLMRQQAFRNEHAQLAQSEARFKMAYQNYQLLFQEMEDAFTLNEILLDDQGKPVDYRFLSVNPAFEKMTGLPSADILGKTAREVLPETEPAQIDVYGKVALTGESIRFDQYSSTADQYFEVSAYMTSPKQFACTFSDVTKRTRAEEDTKKILTRLQSLLNNSPSPIVIVDEKGVIVEVSTIARRILGLQDEALPDPKAVRIAPPEILQKVLYVLSKSADDNPMLESIDVFEYEGSKRYFESRLFPINVPSHNVKLFGYLAIDVTDRIKVEEALKASKEKYSSYIENAPYAVFVIDENGNCLEVNPSATVITGYSREKLLSMSIRDITTQETMANVLENFDQLKTTGIISMEAMFIHDTGLARWWSVDAVKLSENRYLCFTSDITEKKKAEAELFHLSYHDYLTGLYNRGYFEAEIKRVDIPCRLPLSVFIGDINGVKLVNDTFGHAEGDRLIVDCAKIIGSCCREKDTVARIGGDEFGILMPDTDNATAISILTKIHTALTAFNASTSKNKFTHSVSLGFGIKKTANEDITQILRIAEEYMYQRKLLEHRSSHSAIISSIKATMIEKNHETEEHAERLVGLSKTIAVKLNLPQVDQDRLELLATLHDIGKVGISESILTKKGKLSSDEWVEMKRHPEIGYRIAIASPDLIPVAESILCHHERWDGGGYPQGLIGEKIPLLSRILAVVDAYDAMTQDRPYQKAVSHDSAMMEIKKNAGTQFDPYIAQTFIAQMLASHSPMRSATPNTLPDRALKV